MGQQELMAALRQGAEEEIAALWQRTEQEAQRLRDQAQQQQRALEAELLSAAEQQGARESATREQQALRQQRLLRLEAEAALAERLLRLARELLPQLRGRSEPIFTALAAELPPAPWGSLRVHPDDLPLARQLFAAVEIAGDPRISGGLEAETVDGGLRVVNTLEKRLQRLWPQLLPELRKEVYALLDRPGTA